MSAAMTALLQSLEGADSVKNLDITAVELMSVIEKTTVRGYCPAWATSSTNLEFARAKNYARYVGRDGLRHVWALIVLEGGRYHLIYVMLACTSGKIYTTVSDSVLSYDLQDIEQAWSDWNGVHMRITLQGGARGST